MIAKTIKNVQRGEVWLANLGNNVGSVQGGIRPVVILQNNIGNKYSPTTIVVPLTSRVEKYSLPTHTLLEDASFLKSISVALGEQTRVIDKSQLIELWGRVSDEIMKKIEIAIDVSNKEFDYQHAYELCENISNINKAIKKFGSVPELLKIRKYLKEQFYDYCKIYNKNPSIIVNDILSTKNVV